MNEKCNQFPKMQHENSIFRGFCDNVTKARGKVNFDSKYQMPCTTKHVSTLRVTIATLKFWVVILFFYFPSHFLTRLGNFEFWEKRFFGFHSTPSISMINTYSNVHNTAFPAIFFEFQLVQKLFWRKHKAFQKNRKIFGFQKKLTTDNPNSQKWFPFHRRTVFVLTSLLTLTPWWTHFLIFCWFLGDMWIKVVNPLRVFQSLIFSRIARSRRILNEIAPNFDSMISGSWEIK